MHTKTIGDLAPLELLELAMAKVRQSMVNEGEEPGPACGAYAYLSVLQSKLSETS